MTTAAQSVLVFRALMLGDLLCATPALRALRHGLPGAHIALLGLPWAAALCARLSTVDEFIEFPGWPGLPEREPADVRTLLRFLSDVRERHFDLALQMHGSGAIVNPLLLSLGAHHAAGFASGAHWPHTAGAADQADEADAANFTEWPTQGTEVERLLKLTDHLGLPRQGEQLDFPLLPQDRAGADALCHSLGGRPLAGEPGRAFALVHAGSQLPSRRWPPERFAAVADALADAGLAVALTGSVAEAGLTRAVAGAMRAPALDVAGQTTLWTLCALVERAALVVCNDTGISHMAAALSTPSVVVSSGGDAPRWSPADGTRHRVFWHDLPCRPCSHAHCPIGHPCALAVGVAEVRDSALQMAARLLPTEAATAAETS